MSTSPNDAHDENADKQSVDELADANHAADDGEAGASPTTPAKRGRGRPKGSKNKKGATSAPVPDNTTTPTRKRGRPPKEKKDDPTEEPAPKRPRGRPPKPKPPVDEAAKAAEASESAPKKKRGRPPKKPTA